MNVQSTAPAQNSLEDGAVPSSLRACDLEMTGQFLHEAELKQNLFFKSEGGVPRSFTVLAALGFKAHKDAKLDLNRNGLTVIDNDNWRIVADMGCSQASGVKGASSDQRKLFEEVCKMDWAGFVQYCRTQPTYRAGSPDLDQGAAEPFCGCHENQVQLGLRSKDEIDQRSDFIRSIHESGEYNLPMVTRDGMINELLMRQSQDIRGRRLLSWNVGMNYAWDRSGHGVGGEDLSAAFDSKWKAEMSDDPDILRLACDRAVAPFVVSGFEVLGLGEPAACELNLGGGGGKYLMLSAFGGQDLSFENFRELREKLSGLEGETLLNLWTTVRVLDKDLNRVNRAFDVARELNAIRASREEDWLMEAEEEVSFAS